jgi:hypothetical protein
MLSGEGEGYSRRIFVLYDGVHYDALARAESSEAPEERDVTQFTTDDTPAREQAVGVAEELRRVSWHGCGHGGNGPPGGHDKECATLLMLCPGKGDGGG